MQDHHPIAYFSKAFGVRESSKPIYGKELMEIVMTDQMLKPYLIGRRFEIKTNQFEIFVGTAKSWE